MTALVLHYFKLLVLFLLIGSLITLSHLGGRKQHGSRAGKALPNATPA
jgi:hypothetical protein